MVNEAQGRRSVKGSSGRLPGPPRCHRPSGIDNVAIQSERCLDGSSSDEALHSRGPTGGAGGLKGDWVAVREDGPDGMAG